MGFPRQFPSPGDLPNPVTEPASPELAGGFFTTKPPGKFLLTPLRVILQIAIKSLKAQITDILKFINWTHTEYLYLGSYILAQANEPWAEELCVPSEQKHFISCFVYSVLVTMEVWNVFGTARIVKTPSSAWVPMGLGGADPPTNHPALEAWMRNNPLLHQTTGNKNCTNPWPSNLASGYPYWLYNNDQIN